MAIFKRLRDGLGKARSGFVGKLDQLLAQGPVDAELLEELEDLLITSDFGVATTQAIMAEAEERVRETPRKAGVTLRKALASAILKRLMAAQTPLALDQGPPHVILVVGVNGVGKTTTIGKMAAHFSQGIPSDGPSGGPGDGPNGGPIYGPGGGKTRRVMLAAGDTFRAAAVDQLKIWGERAAVPVISQGQNADSASVIFDAHQAAQARGAHLLLADTAGRLHNKVNLMEELKKIQRVLRRRDPEAPHDVWLVLDATTGQNAISQARRFHEALGLTGLVVTKLDGTARGGVVVGVSHELGLPIRFIGVGEGLEDLRPFEPEAFVDALFGESEATA